MSQFVYIMQAIGLPDDTLTTINRGLLTFIWKKRYNNKKSFEKVKRKVLIQDIEKGGLNMVDMKTCQESLYLTWVPKLFKDTQQETWKAYPIYIFSKLGKGLDIFGNTCHPDDVLGLPKNAGEFWPKVLKIWLGLKRRDSTGQYHPIYLNSALCNNARIEYKHKKRTYERLDSERIIQSSRHP